MAGLKNNGFREVQYIRHVWWVMLIVLGIAAMMWWAFFQQILFGRPWGSNPGPDWLLWLFWLIFGIGFPIAFYLMRLEVEVRNETVSIKYIPLTKRQIMTSEIREVHAKTYNPIRDYGGWGVRGFSNRRAYNVRGNRGVELTLVGGQSVMIGSQKPEELAMAILTKLPKQ